MKPIIIIIVVREIPCRWCPCQVWYCILLDQCYTCGLTGHLFSSCSFFGLLAVFIGCVCHVFVCVSCISVSTHVCVLVCLFLCVSACVFVCVCTCIWRVCILCGVIGLRVNIVALTTSMVSGCANYWFSSLNKVAYNYSHPRRVDVNLRTQQLLF